MKPASTEQLFNLVFQPGHHKIPSLWVLETPGCQVSKQPTAEKFFNPGGKVFSWLLPSLQCWRWSWRHHRNRYKSLYRL